jgi:hypothetical protein
MDYDNLVVDFVKRTKTNLEFVELHKDEHLFEFTQLINSLLGIIVLQREKKLSSIPQLRFDKLLERGWQLPLIHINQIGVNDLRNLIRVFRNAVAHFNLKFISNSENQINGLIIYNKNRKNKINFEAEFKLPALKDFINRLFKLILDEN